MQVATDDGEVITYVHVHGIDAEIVGGEVQGLEDLLEGKVLAVTEDNDVLGGLAHLGLDEAKQMLLVHARAVVDVSIDLTDVVKVTMGHTLGFGQLLILVQEDVHVPLALEVLEATESKALGGAVRDHGEDKVQILEVLLGLGHLDNGLLLGLVILALIDLYRMENKKMRAETNEVSKGSGSIELIRTKKGLGAQM